VAALVFKDHLPGILNRARKIGPAGIELDPADKQSKNSPNAKDIEKAADGSSDVDISTPKGRASALKNFQLRYVLEKVYRAIFGTQIEALQLLAQYEEGLSETDLQPILQKHQISTP